MLQIVFTNGGRRVATDTCTYNWTVIDCAVVNMWDLRPRRRRHWSVTHLLARCRLTLDKLAHNLGDPLVVSVHMLGQVANEDDECLPLDIDECYA